MWGDTIRVVMLQVLVISQRYKSIKPICLPNQNFSKDRKKMTREKDKFELKNSDDISYTQVPPR